MNGKGSSECFSMDMGPMGPIGETGSLMLRINRNCPWNRCLFCPVYKQTRFSPRTPGEIFSDIDSAARVWGLLDEVSWSMGLGGSVTDGVIRDVVLSRPDLYGEGGKSRSPRQVLALNTLYNVADWIRHGAQRVFLQDADALAMNPVSLAGVLTHLKKRFPTIEYVSAYARSNTCALRTEEDLAALQASGLTYCLVGIESGSDTVLYFMHKGVTGGGHITALTRLRGAGIRVAAFVMPGLGGRDPGLADHMRRTVEVLNAGMPHEVRVRSLAVIEGSPLHGLMEAGGFIPPGEAQMIDEIGELIEGLDFACEFETLQMTNTLFTFRGSLEKHRDGLLGVIGRFRGLTPREQARMLLERIMQGGYLDFVASWGRYDARTDAALREAVLGVEHNDSDALEKVETALRQIKSKGIP
jgi:hypothetical protein